MSINSAWPPQQQQSQVALSVDDDLIEYSIKRWAPFVCRLRGAIVAFSTDDILQEYARRLFKPIAELVDRYRSIHNQRRRHRPKRGLSMIWDVATNRPRVLFYWSSGRKHFWCCDPLQLCPARFLGDPTLPPSETVEEMVDYSLNVLSFFDPSPVIEGAVRRPPRESLVSFYDDRDSSASEDTYQPAPSSPTVSRTPSPSSVLDDPIIPYRPGDDDQSSEIRLSDSGDDDVADARPTTPIPLPAPSPSVSLPVSVPEWTPRPPKLQGLDQILDRADINAIIASMQESRSLTGNDILRTVESVRHRSIFSPGAAAVVFSPLVPSNITFPANVRPMPAEFEMPPPAFCIPRTPAVPRRADAGTQTDPLPSSQDSLVVAPTQDPPVVCSATITEDDDLDPDRSPHLAVLADDDDEEMLLSETQQTQTQAEPNSRSPSTSPFAFWRRLFPHVLHFCVLSAPAFEAQFEFQTYIRFDYAVAGAQCPRLVAALAMNTLAPNVLVHWVSKQSLIQAPFVSACDEQYALVPCTDGRGVFLCMNDRAWMEFGSAALLETKRRKALLTGPIENSHAWPSICARYLQIGQGGHSIDRFHDDIIDALTDEDTLPDNSVLMQPPLSFLSGKSIVDDAQPLSETTLAMSDQAAAKLRSTDLSGEAVVADGASPFSREDQQRGRLPITNDRRSALDVPVEAAVQVRSHAISERQPLADVANNQIRADPDAPDCRLPSESKAAAGDSDRLGKMLSPVEMPSALAQTQEQTQTVELLLENIAVEFAQS